jgi:hypothetical protein
MDSMPARALECSSNVMHSCAQLAFGSTDYELFYYFATSSRGPW